jgi:hypothetical protein
VKVAAAPESVAAVQLLVPEALAAAWPVDHAEAAALAHPWPHVLVLGPGLGAGARPLLERLLAVWRGPVVLDADALNAFAGDAGALRELLGGRPALLTPHVAEFARLAGGTPQDALDERFDAGARLAAAVGATVLLKGVPTVVSVPDGGRLGHGHRDRGPRHRRERRPARRNRRDAPGPDRRSAVRGRARGMGAWSRRRARNPRATRARGALARVLARLPAAWRLPAPRPRAPVLAELPRRRPPGDARASRGGRAERTHPARRGGVSSTPCAGCSRSGGSGGGGGRRLRRARRRGRRAALREHRRLRGRGALPRDWLTAEEIGYRAAAAALSDLAAMAAQPLALLLAITVPTRWREELEAIVAGVGDAAAGAEAAIVGGDTTAGERLSLTVTVLGTAARPVFRSGARGG